MTFDPIAVAAEVSTAAEFEQRVLDFLVQSVGFDAAFIGLRGGRATSVGIDPEQLSRALRPGNKYEVELAPLKRAALSARGVAVDTAVLGASRVRETAYFRDMVAPARGRHTLMGYFYLRGRVIGGLMLGRTGATFGPREIELVEGLLLQLSVARASFGLLGLQSAPLPLPKRRGVRWPWADAVLARRATNECELLVRDRKGYREMVARHPLTGREMVWSKASLHDPSRSGWPYVDLFHLAAGLARSRHSALFIGCGGAVGPRQFAAAYPGIHIDIVESDPTVLELARAFYALDDIPNIATHLVDGASFLETAAPCSWDVVIVDAYNADELASGLVTPAFFAKLRSALRSGGAMAFNVVGSLDGAEPVCGVVRAAAAEFEDVRVVPVMTPDENYNAGAIRNVVVIGTRSL
jgi:spermidine synthase